MTSQDSSSQQEDGRSRSQQEASQTQPAQQPQQSVQSINGQSQLSRVMYWRFFVNLALMFIDAAMFVVAGATVLNIRD